MTETTTKIKFVPTHQSGNGIIIGELRNDSLFERFICTIEEENAKEIMKCVNTYDELVEFAHQLRREWMNIHADKSKNEKEAIERQKNDKEYQRLLKLLEQTEK